MAKPHEIEAGEVEAGEFAFEPTKAELAALLTEGFVDKSESPILTLKIGQAIQGEYKGVGEYTVTDIKTKEVKTLKTWEFMTSRGPIRLGEKITLAKAMATVKVGQVVMVVRGPSEKTQGGNTLPMYRVFAK